MEILEECSKEKLNEREIYWGEEYYKGLCYAPDGYNIALLGGNLAAITNCRKVSQYTLNGELVKTYQSFSAAGKAMNISPMAIRQASLRKGTSCNYQWAEGEEQKITPYQRKTTGYKVQAYNKEHEIELEFNTQAEAARYFDISATAIGYYIAHKSGYVCCKGYYLAREGEEPVIRERLKNVRVDNGRKIYQYNLNTRELIKTFITIKDVGEELRCDTKGIRNAASGKQNQS